MHEPSETAEIFDLGSEGVDLAGVAEVARDGDRVCSLYGESANAFVQVFLAQVDCEQGPATGEGLGAGASDSPGGTGDDIDSTHFTTPNLRTFP
jgi:hypothetical protein